ncbi:ACVR2A family protein [Megaselia abdita]
MYTFTAYIILIVLGSFLGNASVVNTPPIQMECEMFDEKNCTVNKKCSSTIETCKVDQDNPDKPNTCYTLWNSTGAIKMKGCFTDNQDCSPKDCVATTETSKGLLFCCCKESLCNRNQKWIPTTTVPSTEKPKQEVYEDNTVYILIGVLALLLIGLIVGIALLMHKKRKQTLFNEVPTMEPSLPNSSPGISLSNVQLIEVKASGRFGTVWQGKMSIRDVAVKIFQSQEKESWKAENEIYNLPRMKHPNILEFIVSEERMNISNQTEYWLISTYHSYGSLCDYLKAHTITWPELCKIAESMSRGLMHLHDEINSTKGMGLKPAIAHRDFKSKNVLLKDDLTACIADFGLAMIFQPGKSCGDTHGQVGTRRYMAPEVLEGAINFNRDAFLRIDVYACGLVLWEMVSRCDVHLMPPEDYTLPFEKELGLNPSLDSMQDNVVMKKLRPTITEHWRTHAVCIHFNCGSIFLNELILKFI